jgi:multidrug efflux pump subunit AcrA (membrane-fusion protein)
MAEAPRAPTNLFVEQRLFDTGPLVKANQLLYVLDQRTYHAELQRAATRVVKAKADLWLVKEGVEVLRAESRLAQSKAALAKAERFLGSQGPTSPDESG